MNDSTTYFTADRECLLALLTALLSEEVIPSSVELVLERHLGAGWAKEYASARSPQEREKCVVRRLCLHRPVRALQARASLRESHGP